MTGQFEIFEEHTREYRRSNARGTQSKARLNHPPASGTADFIIKFIASVKELFYHLQENEDVGDMVGISILNDVKQSDKPVGFSFRRKDQISSEVIWNVFDNCPSIIQVLTPRIR